MGRLLAGLGGAFGLAALWRFLRRAPAPARRPGSIPPRSCASGSSRHAKPQTIATSSTPRRVSRSTRSSGPPRSRSAGGQSTTRLSRRSARCTAPTAATEKSPLSRLLRGRGILQGDEQAAAGRRAAARRRGVRPRTSRGGVRGLRRPRARARIGRVRVARRAESDPRRANCAGTLRRRGLAGRTRALERGSRAVP